MKRPSHRWQKSSAHTVASIIVLAATVITLISLSKTAATSTAATVAASPSPSCTATVTERYPAEGSSVGIRVSTPPAAHIIVTVHFKSANRKKTGRANENGHRAFWYQIGNATPGFRVKVDVSVSHQDQKASCSTWFTPRKARHRRAGAWCTATASVYYAKYNWNNVYVRSNQPHRDARASADGYSWSYETNASGYAEIYLNGPPPGAEITVTVGAATCYTSD